jgi:hypothetical protein
LKLIFAALVALLLTLTPVAAQPFAQPTAPPACTSHSDLLAHLKNKFQEVPIAIGVTESGMLLEIYSNADGTSWTAAVTSARGVSCLVATGNLWQDMRSLVPSVETDPL